MALDRFPKEFVTDKKYEISVRSCPGRLDLLMLLPPLKRAI